MCVRGFGCVCMFKFDSWIRVRRGLAKWMEERKVLEEIEGKGCRGRSVGNR